MRLHSFAGALLSGRSHFPALLQQLFSDFSALGNMKNCGQEMQPPQNNVMVTSRESTELYMARSTALTSG
jgi:hypothetical protein